MELKIIKREVDIIKGCVYAIQHNETGRVYVGSTENIKARLTQHFQTLKGNRHLSEQMQSDYNKFGDNFSIYILFDGEVEKETLLLLERLFMTALKSKDPSFGYNEQDKANEIALSQFDQMTKEEAMCGYYDYLKPLLNKVKEAIEQYPGTQTELAEKIGVSTGTITQWKFGQIIPTRQNFAKLMSILYQF